MLNIKSIKNVIFILLIFIITLIPVFVYVVKFKSGSVLGSQVKTNVIKSSGLVKLLNLNNPGDYRYFYRDPDIKSLSVRIVSVNFQESNTEVDRWLKGMINTTVGKNVEINKIYNLHYPNTKLLTDFDLNEIRNKVISGGSGDLNLIYAGSYSEKESSVGLVIHRDTIFIFKDAIDVLSERGYVKNVLEKTTIMHEWGHLLGLDHISNSDCIMDESVEVYDTPPIGKNLPTEYCWEELQGIK